MPFTSRRQANAAFGGHIPGFTREMAEEWADETDFDKLPDRAPSQKGKPTLRSKKASLRAASNIMRRLKGQGYNNPMDQATKAVRSEVEGALIPGRVQKFKEALESQMSPGPMKEPAEAVRRERDRKRKTQKTAEDMLASLCAKIAMPSNSLVPKPGKAMGIGRFRGVATANSLKPPGKALSTQAVNPRRNIRSAITTFTA